MQGSLTGKKNTEVEHFGNLMIPAGHLNLIQSKLSV